MIRRHYVGQRRLTCLRIRGEWVICDVKQTVRTRSGFYDKPGKCIGTAKRYRSDWMATTLRGENYVCNTLRECIELLAREDER